MRGNECKSRTAARKRTLRTCTVYTFIKASHVLLQSNSASQSNVRVIKTKLSSNRPRPLVSLPWARSINLEGLFSESKVLQSMQYCDPPRCSTAQLIFRRGNQNWLIPHTPPTVWWLVTLECTGTLDRIMCRHSLNCCVLHPSLLVVPYLSAQCSMHRIDLFQCIGSGQLQCVLDALTLTLPVSQCS